MAINTIIPGILQTLTLLSHIVLALLLLYFLSVRVFKVKGIKNIFSHPKIRKNALYLAFSASLIATLGSLFYSEVLNYTPCELCWYQRIFMYPIVLLSGIALYKKTDDVVKYIIPMSVIGAIFAAYHYVMQLKPVFECTSDVPCTITYTMAYGYITIPLMALTAFLLIMISALAATKYRKIIINK